MTTPLTQRRVLDDQVARARALDPHAWTTRSWLGPVFTLPAILVAGNLVVLALRGTTGTTRTAAGIALNVGAELVLLGALLLFGRPVAARLGGWRAGLGLDRVRGQDWLPWLLGMCLVFAGRLLVAVIANGLTQRRAVAQAQNLVLTHRSVLLALTLLVVAAVLAPITEELLFRGLVLRAFMQRLTFWPAAALSTAVFALFHAYEVRTVIGVVTLVSSVAVLGIVNCYLVRITGRLVPGMLVHATFNALAVAVALARATH